MRELSIPRSVEWFCSMDWGYNAPGVILWWACLADGHYHIARELRFQQQTADAVAAGWKDVNRSLGITKVRYVVGDPSMWAHTGHGRGESIAETLSRNGMPMRRADNDRKNGWQRCHELLQKAPDGFPWLTVDESCVYGRRSLPAQQSDRKDPDDVNCWVAGTMVETDDGPVPIERVQVGTGVVTPIGVRPVTHSHACRPTPTHWVEMADGRRLQGTGKHRVYVHGYGLKRLDSIECDDILMERFTPWKSAWWSIVVSRILGTPTGTITAPAAPSWRQAAQACIGNSGWTPAVAFPMGGIFTTSMATSTITTSTTSPACHQSNISARIASGMAAWASGPDWQRGARRTRVARCFERMRERCRPVRLCAERRAAIVDRLLKRDRHARRFARLRAKWLGAAPWSRAWCVGLRSGGNTTPVPAVPARIVAVGRCDVPEAVYNLTVADAQLFYANRVLSSNTGGDDHWVDAWRYGAMSRPSPTQLQRVDPIRPGTAGALVRDLLRGRMRPVLGSDNVRAYAS